MKEISQIGCYHLNNKDILMVGAQYRGIPTVCWKYDVLIGPREIINNYKDNLIPRLYKGHKISIKYI